MANSGQVSLAWLMGETTLAALLLGGIRFLPEPIPRISPQQLLGFSMIVIATAGFIGGLIRRSTTGQLAGAFCGVVFLVGFFLLIAVADKA